MKIWYQFTPEKINLLDQGIQDTVSVVQLSKKYTRKYINEYESSKNRQIENLKDTELRSGINELKKKFPGPGYPEYSQRRPTVKKLGKTYINKYENTKNTKLKI